MMIRMVGGWVFFLVPAHPGSPGQRAVKWLLLLLLLLFLLTFSFVYLMLYCLHFSSFSVISTPSCPALMNLFFIMSLFFDNCWAEILPCSGWWSICWVLWPNEIIVIDRQQWMWMFRRKEVIGISAVTSLFVNFLIFRCKRSLAKRFLSQANDISKVSLLW